MSPNSEQACCGADIVPDIAPLSGNAMPICTALPPISTPKLRPCEMISLRSRPTSIASGASSAPSTPSATLMFSSTKGWQRLI